MTPTVKNPRGRVPTGTYFPGSGRRPIAHGTIGGNRAHYRHGEPMCEPCRQAAREARGHQPLRPARCGTRSGYNRHLAHHERPCQPCKTAQSEAQLEYMARRRGDFWPYELLVPKVAEMIEAGLTVAEISEALHVSQLRVTRARARAKRAAA